MIKLILSLLFLVPAIIFFVKKEKNIGITILISFFIFEFLISPKICITYAVLGLKLFILSVFPSLFPFLILTYFLISYDGVKIYSKLFGTLLCKPLKLPKSSSIVLIISAVCGYPLGAKYACDMYNEGFIDKKSCEKLINVATNPSPLFVAGAVGTSMLNNKRLSIILLLSVYISCFIMGLLIKSPDCDFSISNNEKNINKPLFIIIKEALDNAVSVCINVGGYIIIFSVISGYLKDSIFLNAVLLKLSNIFNVSKDIIHGFFMGSIEMTNGCNIIASSSSSDLIKVCIISFLICFSGFSIICQVSGFIKAMGLSLIKYAKRKFLQGIICSGVSFILYFTMPMSYTSAFSYSSSSSFYFGFMALLIILCLLNIIFYKLHSLFHVS